MALGETMHQKSRKKRLERKVRGIILRSSFKDQQVGEIISRMSRVDVLGKLSGPVMVCDVPDVEKGEVLADSRGRGTFQRS